MTTEQIPVRSRRAVLAGALTGLGALFASAIGRPGAVRAGVDGDVVLGSALNDATLLTEISNNTNGDDVFQGQSFSSGTGVTGVSDSGSGIHGHSVSHYGVYGTSPNGYGVFGNTSEGIAVIGQSTNSPGVYGIAASGVVPALIGRSDGNSTGVQGHSGLQSTPPPAKANTGVYGYAGQSAGRGVSGESPAGIGVLGVSSTGYGGYFGGKVYTTQFYELSEITTPAAPVANRARLFVKDNGLGKTQLCVRFHTGAVKVIATEP